MQWFSADMHIHTVLSPCGSLDMSPIKIIQEAVRRKLDIIAITDHNSTKHCKLVQTIGRRYGITVIAGAEVNTKEEVHCLAFFENIDKAEIFQTFIDAKMVVIPNKPDVFGHQLIVDEDENILNEEPRLLIASLQSGIDEVEEQIHRLGGLFIPAHINRMNNGIYNQLGFLPGSLKADALEMSMNPDYRDFIKGHPEISGFNLVTNSDAHSPERIGGTYTEYYLEQPVFDEISQALKGVNGRKVRKL
jgi:PHP family Zn ribbon phosphoesterase